MDQPGLPPVSTISAIKASALAATAAPWQGGSVLPPNVVEIGVFAKDADGDLAINYRNAALKIIALYDAVKAYQPRLAAGRLPLSAQKKALVAALAAMDL